MNKYVEKLQFLLKENKVDNVLDIILVGSRLYKTNSKDSDYDFIVITKDVNGMTINQSGINATLYSLSSYKDALKYQKIIVLESFFAPKEFKIFNFKFDYLFNKENLLKNSFDNIKKTLKRAKSNEGSYLSKKQLFHAIRVEEFTKQILKNKKIINFSSINEVWFNEIRYSYENLDMLIERYNLNKYEGEFNENFDC